MKNGNRLVVFFGLFKHNVAVLLWILFCSGGLVSCAISNNAVKENWPYVSYLPGSLKVTEVDGVPRYKKYGLKKNGVMRYFRVEPGDHVFTVSISTPAYYTEKLHISGNLEAGVRYEIKYESRGQQVYFGLVKEGERIPLNNGSKNL